MSRPLLVLAMQGGGALGAYQYGAYRALRDHGLDLDWVCGVSIGAVNAALIAGNPPEGRIAALERFWTLMASSVPAAPWWPPGVMDKLWSWWSEAAALRILLGGVPGFFTPRPLPPALAPDGSDAALSLYDPAPLRATLNALVDWDRLNDGDVRVTVSAVEVESGNFRLFDTRGNRPTRIGVDHIMASGALPPGLPPVVIDGVALWDGALTSNTPLQMVLDLEQARDMSVFQLDLFAAQAPMPRTLIEAVGRRTDITFSSRTRLLSDLARNLSPARAAIRRLLAAGADCPAGDRALLEAFAREPAVAVGQVIYRDKPYDGVVKDFEFSAPTLAAHRERGERDMAGTLALRDWARADDPGVTSYDHRAADTRVTADDRAAAGTLAC